MFSHSRISAGREFQVDGAATEKARWASSVCMRGTTVYRKSTEPEVVDGSLPARWDTLEWLWSAPCESVQPIYRWPAASLEASVASEAAAWRQCDPSSGRRLWPGCSGCAIACRKSPPVRHSTIEIVFPSVCLSVCLFVCLWYTWSVSRQRTVVESILQHVIGQVSGFVVKKTELIYCFYE